MTETQEKLYGNISPEDVRDYLVSTMNDGTFLKLLNYSPGSNGFIGSLYSIMEEGGLDIRDHPDF